ncbi:MAG: hypothetical protein V7720_00640 [Halioglobus sp.]
MKYAITFGTVAMVLAAGLANAAPSEKGKENGVEHRVQCLESALGLRGPIEGCEAALEGTEGPMGPQGLQGPQGAHGPQGIAGAPGAMGPAGSKGDSGSKGEMGAAGPKGEVGTQGPEGAQGYTGAQGEAGPEGPMGPPGESVSGGSYGGPVVVDADGDVIGALLYARHPEVYDGNSVVSESIIHVAVRFKDVSDKAYLLRIEHMDNPNRINLGYIPGNGKLYYADGDCYSGTPLMNVGQGSGSFVQREYFMQAIGSGPDGNYIPDPEAEMPVSSVSAYKYWDPIRQTCNSTSGSGYYVPAIRVDMDYQYPVQVAFQ